MPMEFSTWFMQMSGLAVMPSRTSRAGRCRLFHQAQGFEHGLTNHRLHDVQLQLTGLGGER